MDENNPRVTISLPLFWWKGIIEVLKASDSSISYFGQNAADILTKELEERGR